jgi:hypothetical protein
VIAKNRAWALPHRASATEHSAPPTTTGRDAAPHRDRALAHRDRALAHSCWGLAHPSPAFLPKSRGPRQPPRATAPRTRATPLRTIGLTQLPGGPRGLDACDSAGNQCGSTWCPGVEAW